MSRPIYLPSFAPHPPPPRSGLLSRLDLRRKHPFLQSFYNTPHLHLSLSLTPPPQSAVLLFFTCPSFSFSLFSQIRHFIMVFSPLQGAMKTSVLCQCTSLLPFATSPPPPTLGISLCTATTFLFGLSVLPFSWQRTGRRGKKHVWN